MAIQEHQSEEDRQQIPQDIADPTKLVDKSRRSFTKSGLIGSGVLLTLASRPVLGGGAIGGWECKSPSGFLSGNVSQHGTPITCMGRTPGYWKNQDNWPSPYLLGVRALCTKNDKSCTKVSEWSGGTKFKDIFNCSNNGSKYKDYSMMQVMQLWGYNDSYRLGAHIVAALLNASMVPSWTPVLTKAQVINMFNEYDSSGSFQPTAGVFWDAEEIIFYLTSTMDTKTT